MQLFLLHIWPSLLKVQQDDLVNGIIEKHRRLAYKERRPRFCTNSLEHRLMFRSLQCLLCLTAVIKDSVRTSSNVPSGDHRSFLFFLKSLLKTIYDYVVETLTHENEPSLRLLAEWIVVRLILEDRSTRLNDLYAYITDAHRHRTGTVCAWISIASHVTNLLTNHGEQVNSTVLRLSDSSQPVSFHLAGIHQSNHRRPESIADPFELSYSYLCLFNDDQTVGMYRATASRKGNTLSSLSMV